MKKILTFTMMATYFIAAYSQTPDYSLARSGDYVLGVYVFINSEPVNAYDYIGKVKKFNIFESDRKYVEKIIKKARKKNPYFNGMIFKQNYQHVELIKFIKSEERVSGFNIGEYVTYKKANIAIRGKIIVLDDAKQKAIIEYIDEDEKEKLDKVPLKKLAHD